MANKAAGSSLCFQHLVLAFRRYCESGIAKLFKETEGKGGKRVSASSKIIQQVTAFLAKSDEKHNSQ